MFATNMLLILASSGMLRTVQCNENCGHVSYHFVRHHPNHGLRISVNILHGTKYEECSSKEAALLVKVCLWLILSR